MRPGTSIVYVATTPLTYQRLMRGHLAHMRDAGFDVLAVSSPGPLLHEASEREGVEGVGVAMEREIRPVADARSLVQLWRLFRRRRPHIVNAGTPKAGMLAMIAARLAGVPVRIYTLRGLRAETVGGSAGRLLSMTEWLTSWCATHVLAVSDSLREEYTTRGLAPAGKVLVLGSGSSNGVQPERFAFSAEDRARIRREAGIDQSAPVIGFVGRLVNDKGIDSLTRSFEHVQAEVPSASLLIVGDYEDGDPVDAETRRRLDANPNVHIAGSVADASRQYSAFDVMAFPSSREGFPNVPLEAAAAGVPTVGFAATGTRDAIVDGRTGYLVPMGDAAALAARLTAYLRDEGLRHSHGGAARQRAVEEFGSERIWALLEGLYASVSPGIAGPISPAKAAKERDDVQAGR